MADFSNYEKQGARPGQTAPLKIVGLRNPDGTHPTVYLEHLGPANARLKQLRIARAGGRDELDPRELLRCAASRLDHVFWSDGSPATDADLDAFIEKIPASVVEAMLRFAANEANYCEFPIATEPAVIAEK